MTRRSIVFRAVRQPLVVLGWLAVGVASAQSASEPSVVEVQWGDTLSAIAARHTGDVRTWRTVYDPARTGISNPDRIQVGKRLELITELGGSRYLKLMTPGASTTVAASAPAKATVVATAPKPVPVPPTAAPKPAVVVAPAPVPVPATPMAVAALKTVAPPAPAVPVTSAAIAAAPPPVASPAPASDAALVIGVLPNIPAPALLAQYDHLKRYLERTGPTSVRIVVPAGFKPFFDSTMRGDYDIAIAAPHFARVAQLDRGMVPIAMFEPRINALLIAPIDGKVATVRDVAGKSVAFANPTSLVAMYGMQWMAQQKLVAGKDFEVKPGRSDMGVGRLMLSGEAAAAIMSNGEMRALPADESARMNVVEVFARIPNFIVVANPRLSKERIAQLRGQFKAFLATPQEGVPFGKATGFTAIVDADDATLKELDTYVAPTRNAMGIGN